MRQRVTFVHKAGEAVDPASVRITEDSLTGPVDIHATREVRVTLALDELPGELASVLRRCHELHARWVRPDFYEAVSPLLSRLPPGLHLFYTPQRDDGIQSDELCNLLRRAFAHIDCGSSETSFTHLPNGRFSHSTAFQFYQSLEDIGSLVRYVRDELCLKGDAICRAQVEHLAESVSLDLSYDTISHSLKVTAMSEHRIQPLSVTGRPNQRTEVGILGEDTPPNLEAHEIGISGHLVVLGQSTNPSPVMFGFPSRHRSAGATFSASFNKPTGLHPMLRLRLSSRRPAVADAYCSMHAYFTLPRAVFPDRYQLADPLFLASKNLTALRYISSPVDLEAPEYALRLWGSAALLELAPPATPPGEEGQAETPWTAEVPLHLRYLAPRPGGYEGVEVPYPAVFWACAAEEGTKSSTNPFDRVNLGYDGLFGPRTVFWHLDPKPEGGETRLLNRVEVPVLDLDKAGWVNAGTTAVVLLGFGWVVWKLLCVVLADRSGKESGVVAPARRPESKKTQ